MLIIKNARELVTCRPKTPGPKIGDDFSDCGVIQNGTVVIEGEKIVAVGKTVHIARRYKPGKNDTVIDASGAIVLPGFIDCHTHAVFGGSRAQEYEKLHKQKNGILLTVQATRKATEKELVARGCSTLHQMFQRGTTTLEIKSGYGLNLKDELKILRVAQSLARTQPQDIIPTFLGAHIIPFEYQDDRKGYIQKITQEMLPKVQAKKLAEYCDVFCDPLAFSPKEAREIFSRAQQLGLKLRIHAEQTAHFGGARLAAEFGATSADHCDFVNKSDIKHLKKAGTIAVFIPGAFFHLMEWNKKSRIQKTITTMKQAGLPIALATDYNPGSSPVLSMKIVMDFALRFWGLSYEECLNAVTINAAHALDRGDLIGSIEEGKQADLLIVNAPTLKDFIHNIGDGEIQHVIKKGITTNGSITH